MKRILIVDDDPQVRKLARVNLEKRGYITDVAVDGTEAITNIKAQMPDLVILDLVMPGINGIDVCLWLRTKSKVPVIVLSARDDEHLKVKALDAGADDYVTKPFSFEELLARVRANLRRSDFDEGDSTPAKVAIGELTIDLKARRMLIDGEEVHLTQIEFALLEELALNLGEVVSQDQLLTKAWGPNYRDSSHYLYVYFGRLRKKMGEEYGDLIETVPSTGYILRTERQIKAE
jgi:two-component system KDP operon response regulator KdpE